MDLLVLAFYLSVLTYYIGVLIYMLPIPFYGVKKWAPQLMVDGVFSATLVFSYNILKWLIDYMGGVIGVDWNHYYAWLAAEINIVLGSIITLKMIGVGLSSVGLNFLANSLISPLISSLTYLLIFLLTVTTLVSVVVTLSDSLLALGIVLHALPFRLTRSSGATLIALVVVFSIGTPLMPQFIDSISMNTGIANKLGYGYLLANIIVYDSTGKPIPYYLYEIYSLNKTLLARYLANENGVVNASTIDRGIPSTKHYVCVKLAGYEYWDVVDPSKYGGSSKPYVNASFNIKELFVLRPLRFAVLFNGNLTIKYRSDKELLGIIEANDATQVIVVGLRSDTIELFVDGYLLQPSNTYYYEWGLIDFKAYNYTIVPGKHNIYVVVYGNDSMEPVFDEVYYAKDTLGITVAEPSSLIYPVALLIYRLFIAPIIYLSILFSATLALSRLLGGSSPKIVKVLVSGI